MWVEHEFRGLKLNAVDWILSSQNSGVETLAPNVMVFGEGTFGEWLGLD